MRIFNLFVVSLVISPLCIWSGALAACISSGTEANINSALKGAGATAVLCAGAIFKLNNQVLFTAANQQIYTTGLPTGSTRAILRITGNNLATAITSNQPGTVIKNIQIDGSRPALGILNGGNALIEIGGNVVNQVVDNVYTHDPRGWSCLHIIEGTVTNNIPACQRATISNNQVGPSGHPDETWADGISLSCGNSVVVNNTITDATDGAVVIFGSPGSVIKNNVIIAANQVLLGGINMVDLGPVNGNYAGTQVLNNTINAKGALIKVGIAMGPQVWGCSSGTNTGATVSGNTLMGTNFGYGFPVNGVSNWTVSNNVDNARHVGVVGTGCGGTPDRPAGYQYEKATSSSLQSGYVSASIDYLLGISEPSILTVVEAPTTCGIFSANQGLFPGQTAKSCDGRFALTLQSGGDLVLLFGTQTLFSTGTSGKNTAQAFMQGDGNFVLYNSTGDAIWATNTQGNSAAYFSIQNDGNLVIYSPSVKALWNSGTCCLENGINVLRKALNLFSRDHWLQSIGL